MSDRTELAATTSVAPATGPLAAVNRAFSAHPASVGETYGQHFVVAGSFGWALLKASFACFVHAVFPFLFEKTGSQAITELHTRMVAKRSRFHG